ncbi:MAG: M14 family metallopeptidase [Polyangiales bacterium]
MNEDLSRLDALSRGFRARYLRHADLDAQLRAWAEAFPHLVRVREIGVSGAGRAILAAEIGPDPDRARPSVLVDANMHASELAGSSVALAIAEDVLRLHLDPSSAPGGMSATVAARVREVLFLVIPRISPDGAEEVLTTGRYLRSSPRDERPARAHARWVCGDVDGDGLALVMRQEDSGGEFVECAEFPGLLVPRTLDDPPPYFRIYPEGHIENFDGSRVPSPHFLSDNAVDFNRNFPWSWAPEPRQAGAGAYPGSEPETRAVIEFVTKRPEIFAWLNLHTFGGVFIRPLGHSPDSKHDREELELWRLIGSWSEELTGYPMVSGFEEFLYEPDRPLHGDLIDYGYHQRGAIAYVCELWDLFHQLGIARKKPFVDHYSTLSRADLLSLARWDQAHNASRVVRPWRAVEHPQLGRVEVGGLDPRVGIWNPPYDHLGEVCARQSAAFLRVAALSPSLRLEVSSKPMGDKGFELKVALVNDGYLSTAVLPSAREVPHNEPPYLDVTAEGCELRGPSRVELGHLDGWGRGLHGAGSIFFPRSRGTTNAREVSLFVHGPGRLTLRAGSCRTGFVTRTLELT